MPELAARPVMARVRERMVEQPVVAPEVVVEVALYSSSLEQAVTQAAAAEVIPLPVPAKRTTGRQ